MKTCLFLAGVEQWAKQGAAAPMSNELSAHLGHCERCAEFARKVQRTRELGQLLPAKVMNPTQIEAIKFRLMAEARQNRKAFGSGFARTRLSLRMLAIAAIVGSAAAAASATHYYAAVHADNAPTGGRAETAPEARRLPHLSSHWQSSPRPPALPLTRNELLQKPNPRRTQPMLLPQAEPRTTAAVPSTVAKGSNADSEFTRAWTALQGKHPAEAATRFDALLTSSPLDPSRRADILYWSAQSHRQAGNTSQAMQRSSQLLQQYPTAPFAAAAALMLGEFAMASDQFASARRYLTQASRSPHSVVRDRAKHALEELAKKPTR